MSAQPPPKARCPNPACKGTNIVAVQWNGLLNCRDCYENFSRRPKTTSPAQKTPRLNRDLQGHIRRALEPWRNSPAGRKPPFSLAELAVMILCYVGSMTAENVMRKMCSMLPYYARLIFEYSWAQGGRFTSLGDTHPAQVFRADFEKVFQDFNVPLLKVRGDVTGLNIFRDKWAVAAGAGFDILEDCLHLRQSTDKPFPFLRLPPELRTAIYEEVLGMPKSGISIRRYSRPPFAEFLYRDFEAESTLGRWKGTEGDQFFKDQHFAKRLAILQVSKQICAEATPVFFAINNFVFDDAGDLAGLLERTPGQRRKHIEHLSFTHNPVRYSHISETVGRSLFKILKDLPHLTQLDIHIDEEKWMELETSRKKKKFPDFTQIPGLDVLQSMRGLKRVTFQGNCENVRNWLVPEMTKPKPEPKKPKGPCKRKANQDEDGADAAPAPKKKRATSKKQAAT